MDPREEPLASDRLRILARVFLLWGLVIFARLIQLQVIDSPMYSRMAHQQHDRAVAVHAPRGDIFDRNGQTLAKSIIVESVCINPLLTPDVEAAAELLAKTLHLEEKTLFAKIQEAKLDNSQFLWIKRRVSEEEARSVRGLGLDWIQFRPESSRYYPKGELLAHILGGVDFREKGNAGIELSLDEDLAGKAGMLLTKADVRKKVYESEVSSNAQPGKAVTLTIDERIQFVAERELATAVQEHHAVTGSLVVMDPNTGQILAMANYPSYDPNVSPKKGENLDRRRNLAVGAPFEPGSVFKVVTLAAALDTTRLTPGSLFHCGNGSMTLFRRVIHDAKPHGMLSMADVLAKSSNIGSIKIALEVGNQRMYDYVKKFGFGQTTGIPLPGESSGIVRKLSRWIPSSIGSVAMGHELSTTTLQLAQACSVVANGGFRIKPTLVISKGRAGADLEKMPEPERIAVLRPQNAMKMKTMMEGVVLHGTGKGAMLQGYSSAGKTGSAQIYDYATKTYTHRYNGSFMGFAPVANPKVVVVVTLNGTQTGSRGFGGVVSAPVFKKVAQAALHYLDVPKDLPESTDGVDGKPVQEEDREEDLAIAELGRAPETDDEESTLIASAEPAVMIGPQLPPRPVLKGPRTPNFQGKSKRDVLQQSSALGVRVEIAGTGIARKQEPGPGVILRPGERIKVLFVP